MEIKKLTWDAGSKLFRKLRDEVIIDPIFHWSKHDDWPCVIHWEKMKRRKFISTKRHLFDYKK